MKDKRIFITGCGGMLGNAIYPHFKSRYRHVLATDKVVNEPWLEQLDIRDETKLKSTFEAFQPNIVLHLAAETDLEYCEAHPDICHDTNSSATKHIAYLTEKCGAELVYVSTAGVFDGKKTKGYTEEDQPNPLMVYGQTKYEGELHSLKLCSRSFVVRAGWMMGGGRQKEKKFIYKILQQIRNGKKVIYAVNDKWGTPTYTYDFANNLNLLIETGRYGLYHMVCKGNGTRYDVAKELLRICKLPDILLVSVSSDYFSNEYYAPRPFSEMMDNVNLEKLGINHMRPWQNALKDYIVHHFKDYISVNSA